LKRERLTSPPPRFTSQFKPVNYPLNSVNHKPSRTYRVSILSCPHARQLYRRENLHPPGYFGTVSVLGNAINWTRVYMQLRESVRHSSPEYIKIAFICEVMLRCFYRISSPLHGSGLMFVCLFSGKVKTSTRSLQVM